MNFHWSTCHVCVDKAMVSNCQELNGEQLYIGKFESSKVEGKGNVTLKMTSSKELILNNVLHVSDIYKNLVFRTMPSKNGFTLVFVSDKFVLIKNEMYVGKGNICDGMFEMHVLTVVPRQNFMNKSSHSIYILELSCL